METSWRHSVRTNLQAGEIVGGASIYAAAGGRFSVGGNRAFADHVRDARDRAGDKSPACGGVCALVGDYVVDGEASNGSGAAGVIFPFASMPAGAARLHRRADIRRSASEARDAGLATFAWPEPKSYSTLRTRT